MLTGVACFFAFQNATEDSIQIVANSIVEHCRELAADPEYMSPFARNAIANGFGADITGGLVFLIQSATFSGSPFC